MKQIEFYWDLGSTNSYFALHLIKPVATRHGARIVPHPFNLGYVFRHHNYVLMDEPKAKIANRITDLHRWARRYKLPFRMPSKFPIKTSPALRDRLDQVKCEVAVGAAEVPVELDRLHRANIRCAFFTS